MPLIASRSVTPIAAACALFCTLAGAQAQDTMLEPVVVSGKGFEQRAFDTPYSVNIVDSEALRNGGLMVNLSESMARVPGLTVANRNNYAQDQQISSRGYGARSTFGVRGVRLYTDGIPATMPDGQGQVAHFDLAGAQRIEVLRGPFSALYGNSSGGVIALFSAPVTERYHELDVDLGRYGTRQVRATVQAPLSDTPGRGWDIRASASRFETDGFRPQSDAKRTLGNVRLGWTGDNDALVFLYNYLDQPADDPLGLNYADFQANPYQTVPAALPQVGPGIVTPAQFNTRKEVKQNQAGVNWRHRFDDLGPLSESALVAYGGRRTVTQWQAITTAAQAAATSPGGVIDFDRDYEGIDGRLLWRWTLSGDRSAQLVTGASYERSTEDRRGYRNYVDTPDGRVLGVTGELRRDEDNEVNTRDVYAQGRLEFAPNWSATVGVRSGKVKFKSDDSYCRAGGVQVDCSTPPPLQNGDDSGSLSYDYTNPVVALQWAAMPTLNLYVSAGRGFESPTFGELAYRPDGGSGFNDNLQAQTSKQVEIGAKWRAPEHGLAVDFAIFESRTDDELGVATNAGGRSTFQNVGSTTRRGAEVAADWVVNPNWRAVVALTWLSARYDDDFDTCYSVAPPCGQPPRNAPVEVKSGSRIAGTSPRNAYAEVAWRPMGNPSTELAVEWRAQDQVATNDLNDDGAVDDFAAGWATFALRARQQYQVGPQSRLELLARLDNVFDREYAGSVIVNEANRRFFEPGSPRAWYASLRWRQAF